MRWGIKCSFVQYFAEPSLANRQRSSSCKIWPLRLGRDHVGRTGSRTGAAHGKRRRIAVASRGCVALVREPRLPLQSAHEPTSAYAAHQWPQQEHAPPHGHVTLFVAWYNFARKNEALKGQTPAIASKLTDHVW